MPQDEADHKRGSSTLRRTYLVHDRDGGKMWAQAGIGRNPERLGYAIVTYKCEKCGELMQREYQD
jgi:hypothetical protein